MYGTTHTIQWQIKDFPLGGRGPILGALISNAGAFWQKQMQKWKKLGPMGGGGLLDPPMLFTLHALMLPV